MFCKNHVKIKMQMKRWFVAAIIGLLPILGFSQKPDSVITKLDSLKKQTDTAGQKNLVEPLFYNEKTKITPGVFSLVLLDDIKQQALSPFHINGRGWLRGAGFAVALFGMNFLDDPLQHWAVKLRNNNPWSAQYSKTITNIGGVYEVGTFAGIAAYGFIFKNEKLRTTTYLATQAYITSTLWSTLIKTLSGRERPGSSDFSAVQYTPGFHGPFYKLQNGNSSFPSGHATLAFAAATVYAKEYKYIPAIPILAYSIASLVSLSRITENRHWTTDILAGAALGFLSGTQVVNNYHRYARLIRTGKVKKKGDLSFNLQYQSGVGVMPGLVYKFR